MSRIGKLSISLPAGVEVSPVTPDTVLVKGQKGELSLTLPSSFELVQAEDRMWLKPKSALVQNSSSWGLYQVLLKNMVAGVTEGFRKDLEVVGVGYRVSSSNPSQIVLNLGFSHPVVFNAPEGISFEVAENKISVLGIDKQLVGQTAAKIRSLREPEPYKGKGIRYLGEQVQRKAGKSAKA